MVTLTAVLVPDLRPLSVGEIIDVAIKIWRRHLPTLARIVVVVVAPVQILAALVAASVSSTENVFTREKPCTPLNGSVPQLTFW